MAVLFGVIVGLTLGLTGGGGSIFAVPLLIYGLGVNVYEAISISLAAVAAMSAFGAFGALRGNLVELQHHILERWN
ncbi:MAG TPA: TSUP family transporter [Burkholderiales bacterium]|nr:TSUP family transporter [Burkholderiales bacterium]